jgi:hypothetical protein
MNQPLGRPISEMTISERASELLYVYRAFKHQMCMFNYLDAEWRQAFIYYDGVMNEDLEDMKLTIKAFCAEYIYLFNRIAYLKKNRG